LSSLFMDIFATPLEYVMYFLLIFMLYCLSSALSYYSDFVQLFFNLRSKY